MDLTPGQVYFCKGTAQQARWLVWDKEVKTLYDPSIDECLAHLNEILLDSETQVLLIITHEKPGTKAKPTFPHESLYQLDPSLLVLVWAAEGDKFYGRAGGRQTQVVDLSYVDPLDYPPIQEAASQVPAWVVESLVEAYRDLPTTLLYQLREYPNHDLPPPEREEGEFDQLVKSLGSLDGIRVWGSLTSAHYGRLFKEREQLEDEGGYTSWFLKRLTLSKANPYGTKYPTGFSNRLGLLVQPFIQAANRNYHLTGDVMRLFATWAYVFSRERGTFFGFKQGRIPGREFYCIDLSKEAENRWATLTAKLSALVRQS